jgi:hypothetical protein
MVAHLWVKKEREILKKVLLAEAYKEVTESNLSELAEESSLMAQLKSSFRGGTDYPSDNNLNISENESAKLLALTKNYQAMYIEGFVTAT